MDETQQRRYGKSPIGLSHAKMTQDEREMENLANAPEELKEHWAHENLEIESAGGELPHASIDDAPTPLKEKWKQEDIEREGVFQPLLVRPLNNGKYEIVAGMTRYFAGKSAGLSTLPCLVFDKIDDSGVLILRIKENMFRKSPDYMGIARDIKTLHDVHKMKLKDIAKRFGFTKSYISKLNALNDLPEKYKEQVAKGDMFVGEAYDIVLQLRHGDRDFTLDQHQLRDCDGCGDPTEEFTLWRMRLCPKCRSTLARALREEAEAEKEKSVISETRIKVKPLIDYQETVKDE